MNKEGFAQEILSRLQEVLPQGRDFIALHEPSFEGSEWEKVKTCLDSGWVSYAGEYVKEFDGALAAYCGVKHAICVNSGTSALHIALMLAGVRDGDEVLVPALTFVASANAISYLGAVPHFIDSDEKTLGISPEKLESYLGDIADSNEKGECVNKNTGRRIATIVPVHVFGHPCDMDKIGRVAGDYNIDVVTDSAESLGSLYKGKQAGSFGKLAILSFNGNKTITTGGGGAILTDDDELAEQARHITTVAKTKHPWKFMHDRVGYNYRMPNLNAALGCAQLERMDHFVAQKRTLADKYEEKFVDMEGLSFFKEPEFAKSNYWLNALLLDEGNEDALENILETTNENGIMTRPAWDLMNTLPMYADCPSMDLERSEALAKRLLNIPSSAFLAKTE